MDDAELKKSASIQTEVTSTGSTVTPWKTATTLTLKDCPETYTGLQFRAAYSYVGGFSKTVAKNSAPANLTVRGPELSVRWITEQPDRTGMSDDNPIWLNQSTHTTQDGAAVYTAEVSYNPGAADLANGGQPPKLSSQWKYHTYEDQRLKVWSADTVAEAVKLAGAKVTPNVTFGDPVYVEDREGVHIYRVTMTVSKPNECGQPVFPKPAGSRARNRRAGHRAGKRHDHLYLQRRLSRPMADVRGRRQNLCGYAGRDATLFSD